MTSYKYSLLSAEEYLEHSDIIPKIQDDWWLKNSGYNRSVAFYITKNNTFGRCDFTNTYKGIRPVVIITDAEQEVRYGQTISVGCFDWTVICVKKQLHQSSVHNHRR